MGQVLIARENLLHHDRKSIRCVGMANGVHRQPQLGQIPQRVAQTVDVIDAQPVEKAVANPGENQCVRRVEDVVGVHA